jgi:hypothetical protein
MGDAVEWQYFPRSRQLPAHLRDLVTSLDPAFDRIAPGSKHMESDEVLALLCPTLQELGYEVETGKLASQKVRRPVLFGPNGNAAKSFDVDAFHHETGTVVEVEAGRGVRNHQFLKDLFEACAIQDARFLVIMVLLGYWPKSFANPARDYEEVVNFIDTLYASERISLPLEGILIVGYDGRVTQPPKRPG